MKPERTKISFAFLRTFILSVGLLFSSYTYAQPQIPTGRAITLDEILDLAETIGGFLLMAGSALAGIAIIVSGIMYVTAGSDQQRVKAAKDTMKSGMIGALIIFGFGIIIGTISTFASDPLQFFR